MQPTETEAKVRPAWQALVTRRALNALRRYGIDVDAKEVDVAREVATTFSYRQLIRLPNLGKSTLRRIITWLDINGMRLNE